MRPRCIARPNFAAGWVGVRLDFTRQEELLIRPMTARGEVLVRVSFGPTSSPVLPHAVSYAIEHAWRTEELRSGTWEATFRIDADERSYGELRELLFMVAGWKTTRVEVNGSPEYRQVVITMLHCAREWLRFKGYCGALFGSARGAARCGVCPLFDAAYAQEFWVQQTPVHLLGEDPDEVPDYVPEDWTDP